jgi:hypothetical protein
MTLDFPDLKTAKVSGVIIENPGFPDEVIEQLAYIAKVLICKGRFSVRSP